GAGMVVLAKKDNSKDNTHPGFMDITLANYEVGHQQAGFEAELIIQDVGENFPGVFIHSPYITEAGEDVKILSKHNEAIVAARQNHLLTCSFHPELTDDSRFHDYFTTLVEQSIHRLA